MLANQDKQRYSSVFVDLGSRVQGVMYQSDLICLIHSTHFINTSSVSFLALYLHNLE